jgi:hypothetical protein
VSWQTRGLRLPMGYFEITVTTNPWFGDSTTKSVWVYGGELQWRGADLFSAQ